MTIDSNSRVGRVAAEHPATTKVFHRHNIDFCCGGGRTLAEASQASGADVRVVLEEIERELSRSTGEERRWDQAPSGDLIDHILATYHRPLREELPRLLAMADKVYQTHGEKDPERLSELRSLLNTFAADLRKHMAKEEQIFPLIREGRKITDAGPVAEMEDEHEFAGATLRRLRELTNNYEVPAEACNTWRALWHGLAELEESMHEHIHLENNILFPRVMET